MTPDKYTITESYIEVGDGHTLYVHDWGNKSSKKPIIFLHGGPGGCTKDKNKILFNPLKQRVIFFDQRGSGKSTPHGSLIENNTDKLVNDIDIIADKIGINKFILTGSSWGSCLSLAYAIARPKRLIGLVIGGVFTGSKREIDWLDNGEVKIFFPDIWDDYLSKTPIDFLNNPTLYHAKQVKSQDLEIKKESAHAYECFGANVATLDDKYKILDTNDYDPSGIIIEMTYLENGCFMPDRYIIDNAYKITAPVWIVQGRYDMICPPITAYELHKSIPNNKLSWAISGHAPEHENINIMRTIFDELTDSI